MEMKKMESWFFMRPGFETFNLEPDKHRQYLFGKRDRRQRDLLIGSLEENCYSSEGYKAAVYGDYGRGKTHQCYNIIFEAIRRGLPLYPMYIKCSAYKSKEPFSSLFREMVFQHQSTQLQRVATEYQRLVQSGECASLSQYVHHEDIAEVLSKGLSAIAMDQVKNSMRWLGGESKVNMEMIGKFQPQLTDSLEYGAVLRGLAVMYASVEKKIPLYLIDEAERLQNVTNPDSYYSWLASMRELTEIQNIAMVFFIGARTTDELPVLFVQPEIQRRIGVSNYIEFVNPGADEIAEFLSELLQTVIRKGKVPDTQKDVVDPKALDDVVPPELLQITDGNVDRLAAYPFEPAALETFTNQIATVGLANKPSEVLKRLQKAAQRSMRYGEQLISSKIVEEINSEGF
jgi:Cdc6-like AAA superfamily ATPase